MSSGKIITLFIIIAVMAAGGYAYLKVRTVSPELSAYVQARYAKQLIAHDIDNILFVDVFGENKIGVLQSQMSSFYYWVSSSSHNEKYSVSKTHKDLLVGISIVNDKGIYQVLLPRDANQLSIEQLRTYVDNLTLSQINQAKINQVGFKS